MPISESDFLNDACSDGIAEIFQDLDQIQNQIEAFLQENLPLCIKYLPGFADGTIKEKGEKELAVSLCKRLKAFGDDKGVLFTFFNEDPDIKKKSRPNDMSVIRARPGSDRSRTCMAGILPCLICSKAPLMALQFVKTLCAVDPIAPASGVQFAVGRLQAKRCPLGEFVLSS